MIEKRVITLYNIAQPVIIVPHNTGIIYSNQTDGCCCNHPELEGYIIHTETKRECHHPINPKIFDPDWWYLQGMDEQKAVEIEDMLDIHYGNIRNLKVMRDKPWEEAWVWVSFEFCVGYTSTGREYESFEGILTWPNSD